MNATTAALYDQVSLPSLDPVMKWVSSSIRICMGPTNSSFFAMCVWKTPPMRSSMKIGDARWRWKRVCSMGARDTTTITNDLEQSMPYTEACHGRDC